MQLICAKIIEFDPRKLQAKCKAVSKKLTNSVYILASKLYCAEV